MLPVYISENNEIGCNVGIPPCCSDQPAGGNSYTDIKQFIPLEN